MNAPRTAPYNDSLEAYGDQEETIAALRASNQRLREALKETVEIGSLKAVRAGYKFEGQPTGTIESIVAVCCAALGDK